MSTTTPHPVLITGAAGYIGSHIALALLDDGHDVVVLDNLSSGFRDLVPAEATFVGGDYGDEAVLDAVFSRFAIGAVIHAGASISVPESVAQPVSYYHNNVTSSLSLLRACLQHNVAHFVFSSSASVYGASDAPTLDEALTPEPTSPYGASKMMVEQMLSDIANATSLRYVAFRYFNVAGADAGLRSGDLKDSGELVKTTMLCATGARPGMEICGTDYPTADGTAVRDYIHVSDIAVAHTAALDYLEKGGNNAVFNLGLGRGFSVREVISAVEHATGTTITTKEALRRPGDPPTSIADTRRIRNALGFVPKYDDLEAIIATAVAWEREGKDRLSTSS